MFGRMYLIISEDGIEECQMHGFHWEIITTTWYLVLVFLMMNTFQNPIAGLLDEEI